MLRITYVNFEGKTLFIRVYILSRTNQTRVNALYMVDFACKEGNIMKMYDSLGLPSKDL